MYIYICFNYNIVKAARTEAAEALAFALTLCGHEEFTRLAERHRAVSLPTLPCLAGASAAHSTSVAGKLQGSVTCFRLILEPTSPRRYWFDNQLCGVCQGFSWSPRVQRIWHNAPCVRRIRRNLQPENGRTTVQVPYEHGVCDSGCARLRGANMFLTFCCLHAFLLRSTIWVRACCPMRATGLPFRASVAISLAEMSQKLASFTSVPYREPARPYPLLSPRGLICSSLRL